GGVAHPVAVLELAVGCLPPEEAVAGLADGLGGHRDPAFVGFGAHVVEDDVAGAAGDVGEQDRSTLRDRRRPPLDAARGEAVVAESHLEVLRAPAGQVDHQEDEPDARDDPGEADEDGGGGGRGGAPFDGTHRVPGTAGCDWSRCGDIPLVSTEPRRSTARTTVTPQKAGSEWTSSNTKASSSSPRSASRCPTAAWPPPSTRPSTSPSGWAIRWW